MGKSKQTKSTDLAIKAGVAFLLFLLVLIIAISFLSSPANAQDDAPQKAVTPVLDGFLKGDEPIRLEADQLSFNTSRRIYSGEGGVVISQGDMKLTADSILVDMKNRTVSAVGQVVMENKEGRLESEAIDISIAKETGLIVAGNLVVHQRDFNMYIKGDKIEKVGPARYLIENGSYSTCDCEPDEVEDWLVQADNIDLTIDGYAVIRKGRIYVKDKPVMYVPYGVFPAKVSRQTGFLPPELGWASDDGMKMGIPFFWAIGDHVDATIDTQYMSERGNKEGLEYRYAMSDRWKGQFDLDYLIYDRLYGSDRWALGYEHNQNVWRRLFLRSKINMVSDNDYVVDFPHDIDARFDSYLRSAAIANYLWQNFDLNVDIEHFDDLSKEDNSSTWQQVPEVKFNGVMYPFLGPLSYKFDVTATKFVRQKPTEEERELDKEAGFDHPYYYLTDGNRVQITPEILAPLSFKRYAYLTPVAGGYGTFYQLNDREEDKTPSRLLYFTGADLHTELDRVFPVYRPYLRGLKHSIQPGVSYMYFPDAAPQEKLPIFDGQDRHLTENAVTYYFDNRLWMKMFNRKASQFYTLKMIDLRLSQDFDFHESTRDLNEEPEDDERRPFSPIRSELDVAASAGDWLNRIQLRTKTCYNIYDERVDTFNIMGLLGSVRDDVLGAEYRYHVIENSDEIDISYLSGLGQIHLFEFLSVGAVIRYSFLDDYFIERIYTATLHSLQNCWDLEFKIEQRELPEPETVTGITLDLTGLLSTATAF